MFVIARAEGLKQSLTVIEIASSCFASLAVLAMTLKDYQEVTLMTLRRTNTERSRMCAFVQGHSERLKGAEL